MSWVAGISFTTPAALFFLLALPLVWWLLRATPPAPRRVRFAPFRLLAGLRRRREEAARTPWWLVLLRMALAAALIVAVAGPRHDPAATPRLAAAGTGPLLVVVDDGHAAAPHWPRVTEALRRVLAEAARTGTPVILAGTAPRPAPRPLTAARADRLLATVDGWRPSALAVDRGSLLRRLRRAMGGEKRRPGRVLWLSDGIDRGGAKDFAAGLSRLAGAAAAVAVMAPETNELPPFLLPPRVRGGRVAVSALRPAPEAAARTRVFLRARNGRPLAAADIVFRGRALKAYATIEVPLAVRNEAVMLSLARRHAGAVWLFDDSARHRSVLVYSGETRGRDQPLLSPAYYVTRALQPLAEVAEARDLAAIDGRLGPALSMLVLADVGRLDASRRAKLRRWITAGGVLLRFAGPRLAAGGDDLVPVRLRRGGRQLGAVLGWEKPQALAPFPRRSPLAGLRPDPQVRVTRQVLAEPDPALADHTWARLADGTPLITARRIGRGLVVLVHVTASPDWSDLPLSGLFVDILARILQLAPPARAAADTAAAEAGANAPATTATDMADGGPFTPVKVLDGFGALQPPPAGAMPLPARAEEKTRPSPAHPPGLYERGGRLLALNVVRADLRVRPLPALPAGMARLSYAAAPARDLAPPLFIAAAVLFLLDGVAMLWLSGAFGLARRAGGGRTVLPMLALPALIVTLLAAPALSASPAKAAEGAAATAAPAAKAARRTAADDAAATDFALRATSRTRFAYIRTGHAEVDEISRAGLFGLSEFLAERTSVEPGEPMAVDIEKDEIAFFPLIYWPVLADAKKPSPAAVARLDTYLKNGGTILFDTRDALEAEASPDGATPARRALRRLLADLDIPPLEPVPRTHVLTRSFYLIRSFPGRYDSARLWVEATSAGRERERLSVGNADGVSAVLITGNDMAGAWAMTPSRRHLLPVAGGRRQREYAIRAGINIVMYALTGNYKAAQVHLPAILRRLGQ